MAAFRSATHSGKVIDGFREVDADELVLVRELGHASRQAAVREEIRRELHQRIGQPSVAEERQSARHADMDVRSQVGETSPTAERKERMSRRYENPPAERGAHLVDGFEAVIHEPRSLRGLKAPATVQRDDIPVPSEHAGIDRLQCAGDGVENAAPRHDAFAHGRSARDDDELAALEARGQLVQLGEAGRDARDVARRMAQRVEPVDRPRQDLLERREARAAPVAAVRDLEHSLLREIDDLLDRESLRRVRARRDVAADLDQPPQQRSLAHDPRVRADVRGARRVLDEARKVRQPARRLELTGSLQMLADGDRVGRLITLDELRDRSEDQPVIRAVQIVDAHDVRDLVPRALIEHEPAEQGLLGFH